MTAGNHPMRKKKQTIVSFKANKSLQANRGPHNEALLAASD
jgi:hypothetical protein